MYKRVSGYSKPLFVACSDIHLSESPPSFRSEEPDWFLAQARVLDWLGSVMARYDVPLVVAGDIFDRAQGSTRLINFVADHLPRCIACPGNHDLPYHSLDRLDISSYGSLLRMGVVDGVRGVKRIATDGPSVAIHLFPFGSDLVPCDPVADINVAVAHHFVWVGQSPLSRIRPECELNVIMNGFSGYDYYIFGDNHDPFVVGNVINCGALLRRKKGDEHYQPTVPLVYEDRVEFLPVPIEDDIITTAETKEQKAGTKHDFTKFFSSLKDAERLVCDVESLVQEELDKHVLRPEVKQAIVSITSGHGER